MLSNLETDEQKLVQIVLVGQPEIEGILMRRELRQLKQRIPGILRMQTLTAEEVHAYIDHRLRIAGMENGSLNFTPGARQIIYEYSEGIPRLINLICERTLVRGYMSRTSTLDQKLVEASVHELLDQPDHGGLALGNE